MFLFDDIFKRLGLLGEDAFKTTSIENQAERVVSALPFPLVVCDKKFVILGATPLFNRLFRIAEKGLSGKGLFQILGDHAKIVEGQQERPITDLPKIVAERNPKLIVGDFPKIGPRSFHLFTRAIPPNTLILFEDVTGENQLRKKIEKSRYELLSVFDGIDDPMVMIDENFRIRRINEAMRKTLGEPSYKPFIGKACYFKLHGRNDICPGCTAGKSFSKDEKTSRVGPLEKSPHPEEEVYQITCYPLKDASGKTTGMAECYRSMTDLVRTEEKLYESERSRLVESLAAGVAHEVRNPLAIIRSTAQYCLSGTVTSGDLKESLETIIKSSENANRVLSALLDFARPQEVNTHRRHLKPLLEEGLRMVRGRVKNQKVRVRKVLSTGLPMLFIDDNRFLQAYTNFLVNALDAMPEGGMLTVEARVKRGERACEITIRDTGKGVPEEMVPQMFRPFYTTKKGGVGLGLPIAEGIVRSFGGRVSFKSREGEGSQVTVGLPLRKQSVVHTEASGKATH